MSTFTWGIIGPGQAARAFSNELAQVSDHKIGAVLSNKINEAEEFAEDEHAPQYFNSINRFTAEAAIDAVYIATPHPHHFKETLYCLERGIPVLCEKPLGINARQVGEMIDRSRQANTFMMEAMLPRFLPTVEKLAGLIRENEIGEVKMLRSQLSQNAATEESNRYLDPDMGGGALLELGVYNIFLAHFLLGRPSSILGKAKLSRKGIDEMSTVLLSYPDNAYAVLDSSLINATDDSLVIAGESGTINVAGSWHEGPVTIRLDNQKGRQSFEISWKGKGLHYEMDELLACVKHGMCESPAYPHLASFEITSIMDEVRRQTGIRYPFD